MYSTLVVPDNAWEFPEQLGTKEKFWFHLEDRRYLVKIGRPGTGENWAEKVACGLCALLGLPHAEYELGVWRNKACVLSPTFVPSDGRLVMGNELLAEVHTDYPASRTRGVRDHTLGRIHALLTSREHKVPIGWNVPCPEITTAFDVFIGYLMFDAWVANQDRHHENWGLINCQQGMHLAPTYDHAASMGQNERDWVRREMLVTRDRGRHISHYVTRARSGIYARKSDAKPLSTIAAFERAAAKSPGAAGAWLHRLSAVDLDECRGIFREVPESELSETSAEFALELLKLNRNRLLDLLRNR